MPGPSWRDFDPTQDDTGEACITANARVGNNSDAGGYWETALEGNYGQHTWGLGASGFLDSEPTEFLLSVEEGGGENGILWRVGQDDVECHNKTYSCIRKVGIQVMATAAAGAEGTVQISMSDVAVQIFYTGSMNCPPITNLAPNGFVECVSLRIRPKDSPRKSGVHGGTTPPNFLVIEMPSSPCGCAMRVVVTGYIHLKSNDPTHKAPPQLGPNQLIGRVYVWTDDCEDV